MPEYGTPGTSTSGSTRSSRDRWGAKGERKTAQQLRRGFGGVNDVWVFHDLSIPSVQHPDVYEPANIDHAVLSGDLLVLIDSKHWAPGVYWTVPFGSRAVRGVKRFEPAEARTLGMAADRYRPWLPDSLKIVTVTAVWYTRSGVSSLLLLRSQDRTRFLPAKRLVFTVAAMIGTPGTPPDGTVERLLAWTRDP